MENLVIPKTQTSPEISLNVDGNWHIKGVSNGYNVRKFYEPMFEWLDKFKTTKATQINLTLEVYYLSTSATLVILDFLKTLCALKLEGCQVRVIWRHEEDDEDIIDLGNDLRLSSKCEIEFAVIG